MQGPGSLAKELGFILRAEKDKEWRQESDPLSFPVILAAVWIGVGPIWKQVARLGSCPRDPGNRW